VRDTLQRAGQSDRGRELTDAGQGGVIPQAIWAANRVEWIVGGDGIGILDAAGKIVPESPILKNGVASNRVLIAGQADSPR
jgi:hypothetical protein